MPVSPDKDPYYRLRHSAAHVMAQAVLELFPEGKIAIGPPVEDGFYYDFDLPRPLTPDEEHRRRLGRAVFPHVKRFYAGWLDPGSLDPFYRQSSRS